jgi:hypothetical protein
MKVQWDLTSTEGNIVDKTLTDTYTITAGMNGQLAVTPAGSVPGDTSQDININAFSNFFVDLNSVITYVKKNIGPFVSADLQKVPVNDIQNFIFPGAKVFTYKVVNFSENQDLISLITYIKPV